MHANARKAGAGASASELEIEKKFFIDADSAEETERVLSSLGFEIVSRDEFVDWYFDLLAPRWHFSLRDCWFRYRAKKEKSKDNSQWRGEWQVKRGTKGGHRGNGARENDGVTVYEEFCGTDAADFILDVLRDLGVPNTCADASLSATNSQYEGFDVPHLEGAESLVPFARLETLRTCYRTTNNSFAALKVDVDTTDFGYMVGEVEAVLSDVSDYEAEVETAKEKIQKLVDLISSSEGREDTPIAAARGKLESYMIHNQRDHYDACVAAGVMN